jgi:hypothetical protein
VAVKRGEAALGAPLGLHGAFWAFRREAWGPLPPDTINDDFLWPAHMVEQGWRIAYDETIRTREAEVADPALDTRRRRRIAAGNAQQLWRARGLLHPRHGGIALAFASGKALRVLMPFLLLVAAFGTLALAPSSPLFLILAICEAIGVVLALLGALLGPRAQALGDPALSGRRPRRQRDRRGTVPAVPSPTALATGGGHRRSLERIAAGRTARPRGAAPRKPGPRTEPNA